MNETKTKQCPVCRVLAWPDGLYGYQKCPNCATSFLVGKQGITPDTRRNIRYLAPATRKAKASEPVFNKVSGVQEVLCAGCALPIPYSDCGLHGSAVDGKAETDGRMFIERQAGWILSPDESTWIPHLEKRPIPKVLRGWFCSQCQKEFPVRLVGDADLKISRARANTGDSNIRNNGLPKFRKNMARWLAGDVDCLDPNPVWAHTGDSSWLTTDSVETPHYDFTDRYVFHRSFHQLPMGKVGWLSGSRLGRPLHGPNGPWQAAIVFPRRSTWWNIARHVSSVWTAFKCRHGLTQGTCAVCKGPVPKVYRRIIAPGIRQHDRSYTG